MTEPTQMPFWRQAWVHPQRTMYQFGMQQVREQNLMFSCDNHLLVFWLQLQSSVSLNFPNEKSPPPVMQFAIIPAVIQYQCPTVGLAGRPLSAPVQNEQLSTDRRMLDKSAGVKSSGYTHRTPPNKLTASKSDYSPAIRQRTGQMHAQKIF